MRPACPRARLTPPTSSSPSRRRPPASPSWLRTSATEQSWKARLPSPREARRALSRRGWLKRAPPPCLACATAGIRAAVDLANLEALPPRPALDAAAGGSGTSAPLGVAAVAAAAGNRGHQAAAVHPVHPLLVGWASKSEARFEATAMAQQPVFLTRVCCAAQALARSRAGLLESAPTLPWTRADSDPLAWAADAAAAGLAVHYARQEGGFAPEEAAIAEGDEGAIHGERDDEPPKRKAATRRRAAAAGAPAAPRVAPSAASAPSSAQRSPVRARGPARPAPAASGTASASRSAARRHASPAARPGSALSHSPYSRQVWAQQPATAAGARGSAATKAVELGRTDPPVTMPAGARTICASLSQAQSWQ